MPPGGRTAYRNYHCEGHAWPFLSLRLFQQHFEAGLEAIASSLKKKQSYKSYGRVMERIGRLRERYPTIARFSYYIRSSRTDLTEKELWSLYMMLGEVEESFRCLKSELGLRPVYHRKDPRQEGHLFITVLAYHLLATIQRELKRKGISHRWGTLRTRLSTHMRATASVTNEKGERIHLRQTGDPEPFHLEIYRALELPANPLKTKRTMKL